MFLDPIPLSSTHSNSNSSLRAGCATERPRPKGSDNSDSFIRSASLRLGDVNQPTFKRQSSLRPSDLPSIQEAKSKDFVPDTINHNTSNQKNTLEIFLFFLSIVSIQFFIYFVFCF